MNTILPKGNAVLTGLSKLKNAQEYGQAAVKTKYLASVNHISSEPSRVTIQVASLAGKLSLDKSDDVSSAQVRSIVIAGIGSATSWQDLIDRVKHSKEMSEAEKQHWLEEIGNRQRSADS